MWSAYYHKIQWILSDFVLLNIPTCNTFCFTLIIFSSISGYSILHFRCHFIPFDPTFKYCPTTGFQLFSFCICSLNNLITPIASVAPYMLINVKFSSVLLLPKAYLTAIQLLNGHLNLSIYNKHFLFRPNLPLDSWSRDKHYHVYSYLNFKPKNHFIFPLSLLPYISYHQVLLV